MKATPDEDISSTFGLSAATFLYDKDFLHPELPVENRCKGSKFRGYIADMSFT